MNQPLSPEALQQLFLEARSFSYWQERPVSDEQLHQLYDLMRLGPTAANSCPARLVFVKSEDAKQRLKPCLDEGNVRKSMTAPVVVIVGIDLEFHEKLPKLFPHNPEARSWYAGKPEKILNVATMNGALEGGYLILAARSLGLDCGPMSGFSKEKLDREFFPDGRVKSLFICALGYGERSKLHPRSPRLEFDEACTIV
ncbi:MAG TPA: malonic semialdehyde reductase [Gammaproteobacteria bacterium]